MNWQSRCVTLHSGWTISQNGTVDFHRQHWDASWPNSHLSLLVLHFADAHYCSSRIPYLKVYRNDSIWPPHCGLTTPDSWKALEYITFIQQPNGSTHLGIHALTRTWHDETKYCKVAQETGVTQKPGQSWHNERKSYGLTQGWGYSEGSDNPDTMDSTGECMLAQESLAVPENPDMVNIIYVW